MCRWNRKVVSKSLAVTTASLSYSNGSTIGIGIQLLENRITVFGWLCNTRYTGCWDFSLHSGDVTVARVLTQDGSQGVLSFIFFLSERLHILREYRLLFSVPPPCSLAHRCPSFFKPFTIIIQLLFTWIIILPPFVQRLYFSREFCLLISTILSLAGDGASCGSSAL